jgi:Flp pilus assembly protein TadD
MCPRCADSSIRQPDSREPIHSALERMARGARELCSAWRHAHWAVALIVLTACSSTPTDVPAPADASTPGAQAGAEAAAAGQATPPGAQAPVPPEAMEQFDKAVVLMTAGDAAAAEQALRDLVTAYPDFAGPLLNLGLLHAKAGRLEEAEKTFKAAIERNPNSAPAFNHLGIVYRRLGRFTEADAAYQQALKLDPNYANAYLNLGVLCDLYLQQPERALEAFERYLQIASAPDEKVTTWVSELKARLGNQQRSAEAQ